MILTINCGICKKEINRAKYLDKDRKSYECEACYLSPKTRIKQYGKRRWKTEK
jgi:uncharacterized CHY-type Zn-finger protein